MNCFGKLLTRARRTKGVVVLCKTKTPHERCVWIAEREICRVHTSTFFLNDRRTDLSSQKLSHNSPHPISSTSESSAQQLMASYCLSEHKNDCQVFVSILIVSLNIPRCFAALDFSVELSFLSVAWIMKWNCFNEFSRRKWKKKKSISVSEVGREPGEAGRWGCDGVRNCENINRVETARQSGSECQ